MVKREEMEDEIICPQCGSKDVIKDEKRGEIVCAKCGTVIQEQIIDRSPEWRSFDQDQGEKRSRVGAPTTYTIHDKGLSTV